MRWGSCRGERDVEKKHVCFRLGYPRTEPESLFKTELFPSAIPVLGVVTPALPY